MRSIAFLWATVCLVAMAAFWGDECDGQDWEARGRFRLCLRQDGHPNSGHAFLLRDEGKQLGCLRGKYWIEDGGEALKLALSESWVGIREAGEIHWRFDHQGSRLTETPITKFEMLVEEESLILTHEPSTGFLYTDGSPNLDGLTMSQGEVIEFVRPKSEIGLSESQMPPSLNEATVHKNHYAEKPRTVYGLRRFTKREQLVVVYDWVFEKTGLAALKLTPEEDDPFSGSVWLIHYHFDKKTVVAGKGTFSAEAVPDDCQSYDFNFSFPRTYRYIGGLGASSWKAGFTEKTGISIRVPLTDRRFPLVPRGYTHDQYYVNQNGRRQKQFRDQTFLEEVIEGRKERKPYETLLMTEGNSFEFFELSKLSEIPGEEAALLKSILVDASPPGFRQTSIQEDNDNQKVTSDRHRVAKPPVFSGGEE